MLAILVQTKTGTSNLASTVVAFDNNTVPGNSIVVVSGNSSSTAGDISGVTDTQGNVYTKDIATVNATVGEIEIWHTSGIIGGANTVTVAYTTGVACAVIIREYYGCIYTNSLDKQVGNTGNSNTLSSGNTTALTQNNELLVGAGLIPVANTFTAGGNFVNLVSVGAPLVVAVAAEDLFVTNGGVQAATFGANASIQWVCCIATFFLSPTGTTTSTSSTSASTFSTSSTSSSISSTSSSISSTSNSTSTSSTSASTSSTTISFSSTSSSTSSTSISSTSSSTSISSTSTSISSTSVSSTSISSTSSSTSISSTSTSFSSTSSSISSTSSSVSSTSFSSTSSSSSTSTTTVPPPYITYSYQDVGSNAMQLFIDNFNQNTLTTSLWVQFTGGSATFTYNSSGAQVNFPATTSSSTDGDITSLTTYNLKNSYAYLAVLAVPSTSTSTDCTFAVRINANNSVQWQWESGQLFAEYIVNGNQTNIGSFTYSATTHKYWRIREQNGIVFWDTSADGLKWIPKFSVADPINLSAVKVLIAGTCFGADTGNGPFQWNNFNAGALPLANAFTAPQYSNASGDDGDYFIERGSKYLTTEYKAQHQNTTDNITMIWKGRSTISTLVSPMLIQIFNVSTASWETLANQTLIPADTDFQVTVTKSANVANYYDTTNTVTFRSYQQVI